MLLPPGSSTARLGQSAASAILRSQLTRGATSDRPTKCSSAQTERSSRRKQQSARWKQLLAPPIELVARRGQRCFGGEELLSRRKQLCFRRPATSRARKQQSFR